MIVFELACRDCSYEFEGWFDNSKDYERQNKKNFISCPSCNNHNIKKSLMAPNLNKKSNSKKNLNSSKSLINKIDKFKKIVEKNYDYVGDSFSEEAKKMKYGEINERPIYGEASIKQAKDLLDEEIDVVALPWATPKKTN